MSAGRQAAIGRAADSEVRSDLLSLPGACDAEEGRPQPLSQILGGVSSPSEGEGCCCTPTEEQLPPPVHRCAPLAPPLGGPHLAPRPQRPMLSPRLLDILTSRLTACTWAMFPLFAGAQSVFGHISHSAAQLVNSAGIKGRFNSAALQSAVVSL